MEKKIKELESTRLLAIRRGLFDRASMVEARIKNLKIAQKTLTLIKENDIAVEFEMKNAIDKLPKDYKNSIELSIQEFEPDKLVATEPTLPPLVYQAPNGEWEDM